MSRSFPLVLLVSFPPSCAPCAARRIIADLVVTRSTGIIWEIFKSQIAKHWREIMEALVRPDEYTYEKAMVLDQELRRSHDKLLSLKAYSDLDELGDISFILSNR